MLLPLLLLLWLLVWLLFCTSAFSDDVPAAPVLGVPATAAIFALSGPTWVFLFVACIKKGQAEADAEDRSDTY